MNSILDLAYRKTARYFSVDPKLVENVYKSYWKFIRETVSSKSIKEISEEEFDSSNMNINLPYLGKLYADKNQLHKYKKQLNYYRNVKIKEDKTNRQSGISD